MIPDLEEYFSSAGTMVKSVDVIKSIIIVDCGCFVFFKFFPVMSDVRNSKLLK